MSQQPQQRQVPLSEIYAIIGQKDVELRLATAQYEQAFATLQAELAGAKARVGELEKQVAEMTEQLAAKAAKKSKE